MMRSTLTALALMAALHTQAAPLVTAQEAALPPATGVLATRGISRGPAIKLLSPSSDAAVKSPFALKLGFEGRGGEKIDTDSVKVTYMKAQSVDLTPRLQSAISASGIDLPQAEVPPGEHTFRVTVKDAAGRESNSTVTIVVQK